MFVYVCSCVCVCIFMNGCLHNVSVGEPLRYSVEFVDVVIFDVMCLDLIFRMGVK